MSQLDVVHKTAARRKRTPDDEDDAFKAIEPELDELFAMDEELVWFCHGPGACCDLSMQACRTNASC